MAGADLNPNPDFDPVEYSSRRPVRLLESEDLEDGRVAVLRPKFGRGWLGRWMSKRMQRPCLRIKLDAFGSFIWSRCDGELTVDEIAKALGDEFGEGEMDDLSRRLPLFFGETERAGMISWKERECEAAGTG